VQQLGTPDGAATAVLIAALAVTALMLGGQSAQGIARQAAIGVGIGLLGLALLELRHTWRNLFRADLLALAALYFLSLFEFWFDQTAFDFRVQPEQAKAGCVLLLWAFGGIAMGRHIVLRPSQHIVRLMRQPTPPPVLLAAFWVSVVIGYLHMFLAVNFNPLDFWDGVLQTRFSRPWARGSIGGWHTILIELGLFRYLIPPLAGVVLGRRERYRKGQIFGVGIVFLLTLFVAFAGGTRYVFGVHLLTFLVGYAFALRQHEWKKAALAFGIGALLMYWATSVMLAFRRVGIVEYFTSDTPPQRYLSGSAGVFVDYNLVNLSALTEVFPEHYDYLGWEVPYVALVQPFPRALWPGKPEGLSFGIEEALGAGEGYTLAVTFVGEAFMSGGVMGIILVALFMGMVASWWTRHLGRYNSDIGILIYAAGFFGFAIGMRSMIWLTTGMLPALGAIVVAYYLDKWYRPKQGGSSL
jgi:hypothetical protein